ncbi:MAG: MBL fold metallo-hydrolase [Thermoguttaceae bacterium]|nr:MBL fold metallo-hydrolase [Thermoguttaceae bacterium]MDW8037558.1 MBL fold metallo-hydrolase [Thermoguttaceae bacterium]
MCTSQNPKNWRTRCSVVLGLPEGNLLIDTPPELRIQLLREGIGRIHAVAYTHGHADHLFGLDDLRIFPSYLGADLPVYCEPAVEARIRMAFDYAFAREVQEYPAGGVPKLRFFPLRPGEPAEILGTRILPIRLWHGRYVVLGFRIGKIAYCTDTSGIPSESLALLEGIEVLILDCLRRNPHPTHLHLEAAVALAQQLRARRTLFTHICHDLDHEATNANLPPGMELAYDGLRISLE